MTDNEKYILTVAHAVRTWAEEHITTAANFDFYQQATLDCMCAYASTILMGCLQHFGVEGVEITGGDYHVFLMVNGKVLDITATQFKLNLGCERQCVEFDTIQKVRARYENAHNFWVINFRRHNIKGAFDYLNPNSLMGFPEEQYWMNIRDLKHELHRAIRYCEKKGIKPYHATPLLMAA